MEIQMGLTVFYIRPDRFTTGFGQTAGIVHKRVEEDFGLIRSSENLPYSHKDEPCLFMTTTKTISLNVHKQTPHIRSQIMNHA